MHHVGMIPRSALILGAGLAGTALARALVLRDWQVTLIDDEDPRAGSRQPALAVHPAHAPDDSPASGLSRIALALLAADARRLGALAPGWLDLPRLQCMPMDQARRLTQTWPEGPLQVQSEGLFWDQPCAVEPRALLARWQEEAAQTGRLRILKMTFDDLQADQRGWHGRSADRTEMVSASVAIVCAGARSAELLRSALYPRETATALTGSSIARQDCGLPTLNSLLDLNVATFLAAGGWQIRQAHCSISHGPINAPRQVIGLQGEGYQIPLPDGRILCGPGGIIAGRKDTPGVDSLVPDTQGFLVHLPVGLRASVRDHLPMVGAVPDLLALEREWPALLKNDRLPIPRVKGLWMISALGGRGLLWCLPAAEHVAAMLSETPSVLNARLTRAIDPARFLKRSLRAGTSHLTKALGLA